MTDATARPARARLAMLGGVLLGATSFGSLAFGIFGTGTKVFEELGDGGVERWVAYPIILWMVTYGGSLAARYAPHETDTETPR